MDIVSHTVIAEHAVEVANRVGKLCAWANWIVFLIQADVGEYQGAESSFCRWGEPALKAGFYRSRDERSAGGGRCIGLRWGEGDGRRFCDGGGGGDRGSDRGGQAGRYGRGRSDEVVSHWLAVEIDPDRSHDPENA